MPTTVTPPATTAPSVALSRSHSSASPASSSSLADALGPCPSGSSSRPAPAEGKQVVTSQPTQHVDTQDSSQSNKTREDLPSDQPLTTHGKPRERVYLACLQCRNRKVRCDGNKPECFNCVKRADPALGQCSYDPAPRRRGKDRTPGSRKLAPFVVKKTRTTRSRVEEEAKRKKAEAAARAASTTQPPTAVQPDLSSTTSVHVAPTHAPAVIQPGPSPSSLPSTYTSAPSRTTIIEDVGPYIFQPEIIGLHGWQSPEDEFHTQLPDLLGVSVDALMLARRIEEEEEVTESGSQRSSISTSPSVQFTRETWWDALLSFYASHPSRSWSSALHPYYGAPLTVAMREEATSQIAADLRSLFHVSLHWFSFIHVPRFFGSLFDPYRRQALQPSLVLALLALGTFFQSSELELGAKGRERALHLLDQAHATFQASLSSGWIDVGLVQTAWLLAMFEMQAHPKCATARTRSAFRTLDSLIRSLQLTTLDLSDPRAVTFAPGVVPIVPTTVPECPASFNTLSNPTLPLSESTRHLSIPQPDSVLPRTEGTSRSSQPQPNPTLVYDPQGRHNAYTYPPTRPRGEQPLQTASYDQSLVQWDCGCSAYSLVADWPLTEALTPAWRNMPMWPRDASEGEQQKEECRRLVWCSVILSVAHNTKTAAGTDQDQQHLWIKDPANYALLFPGESFAIENLGMPHIPASKNSVWALYMRTLFLWNACLRARANSNVSNADRAQFAMTAWLELDNVETAMDKHTCDIQSGFMLQMREVLFNTRMVVSNEFRRYIPEALTEHGQTLYRRKARRWMTHMLNLARAFRECQVISARGEPTENSRRCMLMYWFMSQMMRALGLWHADRSLMVALEVAKAFAPCVEFMMMIWPSPGQRKEYEGLRNWLVRSCQLAGVSPPERAIPPLSTGLAPPPGPTASSTARPAPRGFEPTAPLNTQSPLNPPHLHLEPDPSGAATLHVAGSYQPPQSQRFHPQPHLQPDFMPPFW
ncbi:hypothetical protein L226DRAFT_534271 [Lentinus tigrinus ALCF2SS1-7]|uniref:Zn(2)-C6 fungal-type domain-containing protein n=1 Tax=Lentinus tigrinus ALCF2SS1-6 TaxID=1328759 RepID=A0A5C2RPS1_9APHY|nr:hypothetical protein L227DRAFT_536335 [Lentinus tigrinus ALCF2SS1-6]RPD75354.1 hypothetical protein L226DRAFT_534271 [Lentinus tigrinus ALCF2SS1-7]